MPSQSNNLVKLAKWLRKDQTPWEIKLWQHVRANRFQNLKFKQQVPIGEYIVDFCCEDKKLVIELDGGHHNEQLHQVVDEHKARFLRNEGYTVLRFWNNEVESNLEGVLDKINEVATSLPASPHAWGEK